MIKWPNDLNWKKEVAPTLAITWGNLTWVRAIPGTNMRTDLGSTHGHQLSVMPSLLVSMGVYQFTCLAFLLTTAHAFKITGEDGEKICTLEKSKTNGDNCFYEPECEQVCKDIFVEVIRKFLALYLFFLHESTIFIRMHRCDHI